MTRLLVVTIFSIIFLFSCNQKTDETINKVAMAATAAGSDSLDASMYLLYIRIDTANSLDTLVNLPGTKRLVFKCFFDTAGKLTLATYGGIGNTSFYIDTVPVLKIVPDTGVIHKHLGKNIYIGDLEIDKKQNDYIKQLKDYLGSAFRLKYLIFIPQIVPVDGHPNRNMLMFNIIASPTLPTTQAQYDNLMNMNFQNQILSAGGSLPINPCPPRCN
jgi:hypothetical protein